MIRIRSSSTEIEIAGTPVELRVIATALAGMTDGERLVFSANTSGSPMPYNEYVASFEIVMSTGGVRVGREGNGLRASGGLEALRTFASFFTFDDDTKPGIHTHHEWLGDDKYVSTDSLPLVVAVSSASG